MHAQGLIPFLQLTMHYGLRGTTSPNGGPVKQPSFVLFSVSSICSRATLYLPLTLGYILNQTTKSPSAVVLSITRCTDPRTVLRALSEFGPFAPLQANQSKYLPRMLEVPQGRQLFESGRLILQFFEHDDFGPGTKLVGAFQLIGPHHDALIITLDDDCLYPSDRAQVLIDHLPSGRRSALGGACEELSPWIYPQGSWAEPAFSPLHQWLYAGRLLECQGWLLGYIGVAYWAETLDDSLSHFLGSLTKSCFLHDDVWISGYLASRGVKRHMIYMNKKLTDTRHSDPSKLSGPPVVSVSSLKSQISHQLPCIKEFKFD
jgi:hypothetical protein